MSYDNKGKEELFLEPPKDELSRLFRSAMDVPLKAAHQIYGWCVLMESYLKDSSNGIPANGKDRSSARGNMNKALRSGTMSWKIFKIGLKFLGAHSIKIDMHVNWGSTKPVTTHSITVPIKNEFFNNTSMYKIPVRETEETKAALNQVSESKI